MIKRLVFALSVLLAFQHCANIQTPTGGPKDITPPKILSSSPDSGALNVTPEKITLTFDEYVVVKNLNNQLLISPPPERPVTYTIKGKKLIITLQDTLRDNTTYQFNFGEAIADNNEGNVLSNYILVFSTGAELDSLSLSGKITDLVTGKPVPSCLVLLYDQYADSSMLKDRPYYIARTNDSGLYRFTNLRSDSFYLAALTDKNGNYKLDAGESVRYYDASPVVPANQRINLKTVPWNPSPALRIKNQGTHGPGMYYVTFTRSLTPVEDVELRINYSDRYKKPLIPEYIPATRDTFYFYLSNYQDTTTVSGHVVVGVDTFDVSIKPKYFKPVRKSVFKQPESRAMPGPEGVVIHYNRPVINLSQRFSKLIKDSVPVTDYTIEPEENPRAFRIKYPFDGTSRYQFIADSGFIIDFYNQPSLPDTLALRIQTEDNIGSLQVTVNRSDSQEHNVYLQLLLAEKVVQEHTIESHQTRTISYNYLNPGKYTFRYYRDLNGNQQWDPGNILEGTQPEPLFQLPESTEIRPKWSVEDVVLTIEK